MNEKLSIKEAQDFALIEERMERNLKSVIEFCRDAMTIREQKLYRQQYATFEDYCQKRWGWSRQWVNRQLAYAEVLLALPKVIPLATEQKTLETKVSKSDSSPNVFHTDSLNRKQVEALSDVPADKRVEVLTEAASKSEPLTAKSITEAAAAIIPAPVPAKEEPKDNTGYEIPVHLQPIFENPGINKYLHHIGEVRGFLRRLMEARGHELQFIEVGSLSGGLDALDTLYAELKRAVPYAVCLDCSGIEGQRQTCLACTGRGWVSEFFYLHCASQEHRNMRKAVVADKENQRRKAA